MTNANTIAALATAIAALITAIVGVVALFRKVGEVHSLVNDQLDRQLRYSQQLAAALTKAGVTVPEQEKSQ